jgi:Holliday junction resolvase RusA-like endonuclease
VTELLRVFVPGHARSKGSLKPVVDWRRRKVWLEEQVSLSKPWRKTVQAYVVRQVWKDRPVLVAGEESWKPYPGPVAVSVDFVFERPKSGQGLTDRFPIVSAGPNAIGDLDKLIRNILDALQVQSGAGLITNDAHVCKIISRKVYSVGELGGAYIKVEAL